jgi:hypothetical protein
LVLGAVLYVLLAATCCSPAEAFGVPKPSRSQQRKKETQKTKATCCACPFYPFLIFILAPKWLVLVGVSFSNLETKKEL